MGPCMCGDIYCPSCGPAQGNWRCPCCGMWSLDAEENRADLNPFTGCLCSEEQLEEFDKIQDQYVGALFDFMMRVRDDRQTV